MIEESIVMHRQYFWISFLFLMIIHQTISKDLNQLEVIELCRTGQWKFCAEQLSEAIWNNNSWYDEQLIHLCQIKCWSQLNGRVEKFRWVWDAKFSCDEQLPRFIGQARGTDNRHEAMTKAMSKVLEEILNNRLMTIDDFLC